MSADPVETLKDIINELDYHVSRIGASHVYEEGTAALSAITAELAREKAERAAYHAGRNEAVAERDEARRQLQRVARNNAWFEPDGPTPLERVRALVEKWRAEHQPDEVAEGLYICTVEGGGLPYRACPVRRCADELEAALAKEE